MIVCLRGFILSMSEKYGLIDDGLVVFDDSTGLIEDVKRWSERGSVRCDLVEGEGW